MQDDFPLLKLPDGSPRVSPRCKFCITVPAKDEAGLIAKALEALYLQTDPSGKATNRATYEVILLANNCIDDTAEIARDFGRRHPDFQLHVVEIDLPPETASVGVARRLLAETAVARLPEDGIVITTDADSHVDPQWLYHTERAFERGAQAVGGRIIVSQLSRSRYRKTYLQDVTYRMLQARLETIIDPSDQDPWPRHFQNSGPSIALRVDAYRACGGMPPVNCIEDIHLVWALERIDIDVVHDPNIKVYTSDRESERIDGIAFSHTLDEWTRMQHEGRRPAVWGLLHCIQFFKWKVALRKAFYARRIGDTPALHSLMSTLGIDAEELERYIMEATSAGELCQKIRRMVDATHGYSDTTFERAIADLRRFTRSARSYVPYVAR